MNKDTEVQSEKAEIVFPKGKYIPAVGRRKRAVARVKLFNGKGEIIYNKKKVIKPNSVWLEPITLLSLKNKFDLVITVSGGGKMSQAEAVRMAVARTLNKFDAKLHTSLRMAGFLTRDPREKERKKPGLRRARRAPQWAKR